MTDSEIRKLAQWLERPTGMLYTFVMIAVPATIAAHLLRWWLG